MKTDNERYQKKLGQILVEEGNITDSDIEKALSLQKENPDHQLLGMILMKMKLITKDTLIHALNKQLELLEEKPSLDFSDNEAINTIVNKYRETEYFNDLNELMGVVTHKVRNPLAGISAAVEVLRERVGKENANEKIFDMILKEIDRLENIVKELFRTFSNK